jgi:hypothetical protein
VPVPVVPMPNPWKAMLELLRAHPDLPEALQGNGPDASPRVCASLPPHFPEGLPVLHVTQVPGGRRNVPLRLATALFDLHVYDADLFDAMELARFVAAVVQSLEGRATTEAGFTVVRLTDEPFPLEDPDTRTPRAVIPISATYRPV